MFGLNHEETFRQAKRGGRERPIAYFQRNRNSLSAEGLWRTFATHDLKFPFRRLYHLHNRKCVFI